MAESKHPNMWPVAERVLPHCDRALLYGPPGTGKTFMALHLAAAGQATYSVTVTEDMSASALCGHFVPTDSGAFRWHDGPGARGWREGAVIVLNEVNLAGGDLGAYLLNLCDDTESAVLTLTSGETIRPAKGTRIVATMNGDPSDLSEPLRTRFPVALYIDRPHPAALAKLPADLQGVAARTTADEDADKRVNLRTWYAFAALRQRTDPETAALACFGMRAKEVLNGLKIGAA